MLRRLTIVLILAAPALYAQTSSPLSGILIGPERRVAEQRIATRDLESFAGIVPDGDGLVVVWTRFGSQRAEIRAMDVGPAGEPRYETSRELARGSFMDLGARASRTASGPIVVWTDTFELHGFAQRLGAERRSIGDGRFLRGFVCNDSRCLVMWRTRATILDGDGNIAADDIPLSLTNTLTAAAADPGGFLLAGTRNGEIVATRIDNRGARVFETILSGDFLYAPIAADFDGTSYAVAWSAGGRVRAATLSLDGSFGEPSRLIDTGQVVQQMIWDGSHHHLELVGMVPCPYFECSMPGSESTLQLDRDLAVLNEEPVPLTPPDIQSAPGPLALDHGTVYAGFQSIYGVLMGSRLDGAGAPIDRNLLSLGPQEQFPEDVIPSGDHDLVVWTERDALTQRGLLRAMRVTRDGVAIDSAPRTVGESDSSGRTWAARVGSDVLVALTGTREPSSAVIIHDDGSTSVPDVALPPLPILAVAGSDRSWLVLCGPNAAWVISRAGIDLTPQTLSISGTAAASDGTNFLVAGSGLNGVIATVVTSDGSVVVKDRPVLAGGLPVGVRSNGREYLIAARDTTRVMLQRVDAEGSPLGQPIEVPATGNSLINIAPFGRG